MGLHPCPPRLDICIERGHTTAEVDNKGDTATVYTWDASMLDQCDYCTAQSREEFPPYSNINPNTMLVKVFTSNAEF